MINYETGIVLFYHSFAKKFIRATDMYFKYTFFHLLSVLSNPKANGINDLHLNSLVCATSRIILDTTATITH